MIDIFRTFPESVDWFLEFIVLLIKPEFLSTFRQGLNSDWKECSEVGVNNLSDTWWKSLTFRFYPVNII